jgi:hypothetical protein
MGQGLDQQTGVRVALVAIEHRSSKVEAEEVRLAESFGNSGHLSPEHRGALIACVL